MRLGRHQKLLIYMAYQIATLLTRIEKANKEVLFHCICVMLSVLYTGLRPTLDVVYKLLMQMLVVMVYRAYTCCVVLVTTMYAC